MRLALLVTCALATGCSGLVDNGGNGGLSDAEVTARRLWFSKALPVLQENCASCHATGVGGSDPALPPPTFLAGTNDLEIRDTILAHQPPVISVDAPGSSFLLTRGAHDGPAFAGNQGSDILEWIVAEKAAGSVDPVDIIGVTKFAPAPCTAGNPGDATCPVNTVTLDEVGAAGSSVTFVMQVLPDGMYMTNMTLVPGPSGLYIEHPLFVTHPAEPVDRPECGTDVNNEAFCTDVLDRFATTKLNLAAGAPAQPLGSGTTTFTTFVGTDMISLRFTAIGPPMP